MDAATLLEIHAGIATITLNRPENRNALSVELVDSLADHLDQTMADPAVRLIVLTNTGNTFCAGADLKAALAGGPPEPGSGRTFIDIFNTILDASKPVIGRINGHALAGGLGLAAVCDISVMAASATLGFTEVRIGVAPAVISVVCLPKMRRSDALELFLTGERISAARGAEVGLVNYAVADDELDDKVAELVAKVVRGGPTALAVAKQLVARVPQLGREEAFAWTGPLSAGLFAAEEGQEGITAFRNKRDPAWIPETLPKA